MLCPLGCGKEHGIHRFRVALIDDHNIVARGFAERIDLVILSPHLSDVPIVTPKIALARGLRQHTSPDVGLVLHNLQQLRC